MGVLRPRFSEEEKEEIKQIIEEGLLENRSCASIAADLGVSDQTVMNYKKVLIAEGRIPDNIQEKQKKELWEQKKGRVHEGVDNGMPIKELARFAAVGEKTLSKMIQELIDERYNRGRVCRKKKRRSRKR
ncbi:MAG: hypothetical protein HFJ24_07825 [Clostridia bacterium]|nr:hypothetical protein [Clostridia bacterium]MCI9275813.1 hypothetical protein [Clostridia bacterium]